jgi:glucose/arabinose dehydrogenase
VVASHLDVPWGIAFLPDGSALVTERDTARLLRVTPAGRVSRLGTVPGVTPTSEGGLLGVAVSPTYRRDHTVFVYATTGRDNRVLAGTVGDLVHGRGAVIVSGIPRGEIHDGGRLAFGPDHKLYVTTGETGQDYLAPSLDSLGGKILRVNPDGSIPADNPFPHSPIWSYGHRNVEGIAWDDQGRLWATEFGSEQWDEINLIEPGNNYGWPAAEGTGHLDGRVDPYAVFRTSAASPAGLAYASGALWLGALQGKTTWRVPVTASGLGRPQAVRLADERTRTVVAAPDGTLWVTTSETDGRAVPKAGDDRILAIKPW